MVARLKKSEPMRRSKARHWKVKWIQLSNGEWSLSGTTAPKSLTLIAIHSTHRLEGWPWFDHNLRGLSECRHQEFGGRVEYCYGNWFVEDVMGAADLIHAIIEKAERAHISIQVDRAICTILIDNPYSIAD